MKDRSLIVETAPKEVVFGKSTASPENLARAKALDIKLRVYVGLEDPNEPAEPAILTDDGLIFDYYDLEHDEVLVELGEEPTEAFFNAACALENPVSYLIDQCTWLGDRCWGLILCDWAAEALSLSTADMHKEMLQDLEVAKLYWTGEAPLTDVEEILSKRLWGKIFVASSASQIYNRWFDNTSSLAKVAMSFPTAKSKYPELDVIGRRHEDITKHVLNAWHSLIVTTVAKQFLESKKRGDWQDEHEKIKLEKRAAKIYARATLRKIKEYERLGYVAEYIECHCTKQDFLLTVGLDKIQNIEAWSGGSIIEDEDDD